jgi:hypothetical protein
VHWRRDGRVPVRSQEFEALGAWLGYGAITVFLAFNLFFLNGSSLVVGHDYGVISPLFGFWVIIHLLINHALGWLPDDDIVSDERGQYFKNQSRIVGYIALGATALFSLSVFVLDNDFAAVSRRTMPWFVDYLLFCFIFSHWSELSYEVYRYACDRFFAWRSKSDA